MSVQINIWSALSGNDQAALLARPELHDSASLREDVVDILNAVRRDGDDAVKELTKRFDHADLESARVAPDEFERAQLQLSTADMAAVDLAIANVRKFHEQQRPCSIAVDTMPGVKCERVSHPLDSVGLYVPAGTAPLPSAAIMLAVPAAIAACPIRILCTPPRPDGSADPAVLVAARRAGVDTIFKIGGAQAIGAMAYGTATVPRVCKIFGPGNAWVTCAKSIASADPKGAAIDMPAGPSEVLVIADAHASAEFVAADLLSQAEHGVDSQVVLLTSCELLAQQVQAQIEAQLDGLSRAEIARAALLNSQLIVVESLDLAVEISNRYAPEHLILQTRDARRLVTDVRNAGSVFVGPWTPEAVGDYCSGTNHVLPTYGFANTYSGLGVDQFMRQMTIQEVSRSGLEGLAPAVMTLAKLEGLDAHAAAVSRRMGRVT